MRRATPVSPCGRPPDRGDSMRRMRRLLLASLIAAASSPSAPSAQDADLRSTASAASMAGVLTPPLSPRNASYTITARLDPATRTITGSETITWRNITGRPAADLQFHLYWNAWKNTRSTFMRERALGGGNDDRRRRPDEWARIDVTAITVAGADRTGLDALHRARRRQPERRDGDVGAAGAADRARRQRDDRGRLDGARAAHLRAHRRDRQLLLHRAVVSRSSACCRTTAGTAISSTPAPSSSPTTASTTCR